MDTVSFRRFGRVSDHAIKKAKTCPEGCSLQRWKIELRRRKLSDGTRHVKMFDDIENEHRVLR